MTKRAEASQIHKYLKLSFNVEPKQTPSGAFEHVRTVDGKPGALVIISQNCLGQAKVGDRQNHQLVGFGEVSGLVKMPARNKGQPAGFQRQSGITNPHFGLAADDIE